jgi:hypothetical protein
VKFRIIGVVAAVFACVPIAAFAQALDLTPYPARILSDPDYLPLAGQIYGTSSFTHGWINGNSVNYLGAETSTFHFNTNTLDQMLAYGITDDLTVRASIDYAPENYRAFDSVQGTSTYSKTSGFSDPGFGLTWRALDQQVFPVNLDLFGSYTPDWISAHTATASQDGTVARGGDAGTVGAALGYETRSFTIRGAFDANFLGDSSVSNLATGGTVQTAAHTTYDLLLDTQTRLGDLFSVNAGVTHTFDSSTSATNLPAGTLRTADPGDLTTLQLALNYNFIPNAFVVSATYAHDFYGNSTSLYANPIFNTETRDRNGDIVGVKLYYTTP